MNELCIEASTSCKQMMSALYDRISATIIFENKLFTVLVLEH